MQKFLLTMAALAVISGPAVAENKLCADARAMWPDVRESGSIVALESFASTFPACPIYLSLAEEKLAQLKSATGDSKVITHDMPSEAYSLDEETCLTLASAPFQLEDYLGVFWSDMMVEPALEACEKAFRATDTLDPEVRAVYARVLTKSGEYDAAASQARIAAEEGSALAMNTLAVAYELGRGTEKNSVTSLMWFAEAAAAGFPYGQYNLAERIKSDDPELAVKHYRAAADAGHGSAQTALGKLYREGDLVSKDLHAAMSWFEMAIEDNQDIDAMYWAALILSGDSGAYPLDYERALSLYERSADAGDKWSQHNVASMYFHGKGAYPNLEKATYYFGLAAEQGHVMAMRKYGRLKHENGDWVAALYWYQRAENEGDEVAAELLAKLLDD